jgi:hypothetical protein
LPHPHGSPHPTHSGCLALPHLVVLLCPSLVIFASPRPSLPQSPCLVLPWSPRLPLPALPCSPRPAPPWASHHILPDPSRTAPSCLSLTPPLLGLACLSLVLPSHTLVASPPPPPPLGPLASPSLVALPCPSPPLSPHLTPPLSSCPLPGCPALPLPGHLFPTLPLPRSPRLALPWLPRLLLIGPPLPPLAPRLASLPRPYRLAPMVLSPHLPWSSNHAPLASPSPSHLSPIVLPCPPWSSHPTHLVCLASPRPRP